MAEAGRVIAGSARGRRLRAPGEGTRPFGDRVKQTLFAILDPDLPGARVLDLFAGSGAGGIEALSRGAAVAVFVERDAAAARVIDENLHATGLSAKARVVRGDAIAYLKSAVAAETFDLVLLDPPYAETGLMEAALARLGSADAAFLAPEGWVVAKHFWRTPPPPAAGLLASVRNRRFGETALTFYRPAQAPSPGAGSAKEVAGTDQPAGPQEAAR
jgi:16S rRNA (guanine(966)-N(2))-methyltransferase RsmD